MEYALPSCILKVKILIGSIRANTKLQTVDAHELIVSNEYQKGVSNVRIKSAIRVLRSTLDWLNIGNVGLKNKSLRSPL